MFENFRSQETGPQTSSQPHVPSATQGPGAPSAGWSCLTQGPVPGATVFFIVWILDSCLSQEPFKPLFLKDSV